MTDEPGSWGTAWTWRDRWKWMWHNLVPLSAVILAAWAVIGSDQARERADAEGLERRDQICLSAEREHLNDVIGLQRTYSYLKALTDEERQATLNRFIIRGLAETEDRVRVDPAPAFCDEPNVGLPEPDPPIPVRPSVLTG